MTVNDQRMHPAIAELAALIGIDASMLRQDVGATGESVSRTDGKGRYWRVERFLQCDGPREGEVDHEIESRPREVVGMRRLTTHEGVLEIVVHPGSVLPEMILGALEGRRLGEILEVTGPGADLRAVKAMQRIMGADGIRPLHLEFEKTKYVSQTKSD